MRRSLRVLHRWAGLVLVLPLLVQGMTGFVLAVTPVWEALRTSPAVSQGVAQPASAILAAAATPGLVVVRFHPGAPAVVDLAAPGGRLPQRQVMVDPVSLAVLGTRTPSHFYRFMHSLHETLLLPPLGRSIVGWFAAGLLLMGLSGLVLWWPAPGRWRAAFTVAGRARGARLQRELHGAAGFYACVMLVVMSISGMTLAFPQTIRAALHFPAPRLPRGDNAPFDIDAVIARAQQAAPGASLVELRLPNAPGRPVMLSLHADGTLAGAPPIIAMIDPAGRFVLSLEDPRTESTGAAVLAWLRAIHFGQAFGPAWRAAVVLTGILLPLLTVTGATLWFLRQRNRNRLAQQRNAALQGAQP
jgi:uncharacterized iron-regulated membrane protein